MSCRTNKLKYNCGQRLNARCVFYDGYIPEDSDLTDEDCVVLEETTADLYGITDTIKEEIDLGDISDSCIDYEETENGDVTVKEAVIKHKEEICALKDAVENIDPANCCIDLESIDTGCLVDPCDAGFATQEDLIQAIITKLCELEVIVNQP